MVLAKNEIFWRQSTMTSLTWEKIEIKKLRVTSRALCWVCGWISRGKKPKRQSELNEMQILHSVFMCHVVFRCLCGRHIQSWTLGTSTSMPLCCVLVFVTHPYIKTIGSHQFPIKHSPQIEFNFFHDILPLRRHIMNYLITRLVSPSLSPDLH